MPWCEGTRSAERRHVPVGAGAARALTACIVAASIFPPISAAASHDLPLRYVLILNSYRRDTPYTELQENAIRRVLHRDKGLRICILYEYLGATTQSERESFHLLAPVMRNRLAGRRLDLVVTTDTLAFQFAQEYRESLFPGLPIVFSALPSAQRDASDPRAGVSGVVEEVDVGGTLDMIRRLQPDARRLAIVADDSGHCKILRQLTETALKARADPFEVHWLERLNKDGLVEKVVELPPDSAVLYLSDYYLNTGSCEQMNCDLCEIGRRSPVPVYALYDVYLAHELLGGHVTSGQRQGQIAGEIALRVLHGEPIASIPVVRGMSNQPMLNWRAMERWGIEESRLPPGAVVEFRELGFFERYASHLVTIGVIFGGQTLFLVAAYLSSRSREKREAAARKASDRRLELVTAATSDGVWDWSVQTGEVFYSESWSRSLGYEPAEVGSSVNFWLSIVHPDDMPRVRASLDAHFQGKSQFYECEYRLRMASGKYRWHLDRGRVVEWDAAGRPVRMVGADRDITFLRRTNEALRAVAPELESFTGRDYMRELARSICETLETEYALLGEIIADDARRVQTIYVHTPAGERPDFRYDLDGTACDVARRDGICVHERGVAKLYPRDALLRQMEVESYAGIRLRDASGIAIGIFCVMGRQPLRDVASVESLLRIVGVRVSAELERLRADRALRAAHDELENRVVERTAEWRAANSDLRQELTRRRDVEAALRGSEQRFHQLADATFEGIALHEQGRITAANQALADMFGIPRDGLIGMLRLDLIAPVARPAAREAMRDDVLQDTSRRHESIGLRADGSEFPIEMRARRLQFAGRTVHVTAIQDISERRAAQESEARHRAELAHVLRRNTLGELASGLAHELNQPLAAISNYARACQRKFASGRLRADEIATALSEMGGQCDRAGMIIQRMRHFVRKGEPQTSVCDINEIVRSAVRFIEAEARREGIAVSSDLQPDLPSVEADPVQLEQVVLNLVRNACDATRSNDGGPRAVSISTGLADGCVRVSVTDTGPGLAPRIRERLFDAFQTTKAQGLGLGLSISRSIIEAHGGRIWYERGEALGSAFHFSLKGTATRMTPAAVAGEGM